MPSFGEADPQKVEEHSLQGVRLVVEVVEDGLADAVPPYIGAFPYRQEDDRVGIGSAQLLQNAEAGQSTAAS